VAYDAVGLTHPEIGANVGIVDRSVWRSRSTRSWLVSRLTPMRARSWGSPPYRRGAWRSWRCSCSAWEPWFSATG